MNLNQVTLLVSDIPRAVAFYKKLGLLQIVESPHYARFVCPDGEATFSVHLADETFVPSSAVIYFECSDLDQRVASLKSQGLLFETDPEDQRWLWREARLRDPDGNPLCLFWAGENRINPPWRIPS